MKIRLDKALVERGLAGSRERAQALILAGRVLVAEQSVEKPGTPVEEDAALRVIGEDLRYVGRGGLKLERALEYWEISLEGRACVDVGAFDGRIHRLHVAAWRGERAGHRYGLRADRAFAAGGCAGAVDGAMQCEAAGGGELQVAGCRLSVEGGGVRIPAISFLAMDVSFISATLVLPAVLRALVPEGETWRGEAVVLIKPQFEAGREHVGKGGIVREQAGREIAIERVKECVAELDGTGVEVIDSPITGMEGNREYLLHGWFGGAQ